MKNKYVVRVLGLALLAAIGVMAVSAAAAQAKWLIKVNGASVKSAKIVANIVLSNELLVGGLGFSVRCAGGTAAAELATVNEDKELVGSGMVEFTGCVVVGSEKVCTINTPGKAAGKIVASGSGYGQMVGEKTFTELSSAEFTTIEISGALCSLDELEAVISGTGTGTLVSAATELKTHLVEIDEKELFFGQEEVDMHSSGKEASSVKVEAQEAQGRTWSIQLVGL